tara:strand:- start:513 stop:623 length:111 start_codon:yes stop_codon:yes gene_type:complete
MRKEIKKVINKKLKTKKKASKKVKMDKSKPAWMRNR